MRLWSDLGDFVCYYVQKWQALWKSATFVFTKEKRTAEYSPSAMDNAVTFLSPTLDDDAKVRKDYELSKS